MKMSKATEFELVRAKALLRRVEGALNEAAELASREGDGEAVMSHINTLQNEAAEFRWKFEV